MIVRRLALLLILATSAYLIAAPPAAALNPLKPACGAVGVVSPAVGHVCKTVAGGAGTLATAGAKLATGQIGGAAGTLLDAGAGVGLSAIGSWVLGGASFALHETAELLGQTTSPQLSKTWFSSAYWRTAAIAAVLTVPFLFAAAIQALLRSDLGLLLRAAFGYLPLAMLAVGVAAPLTMLMLAASDQMSSAVSAAAGQSGARYLARAAVALGTLSPLPEGAFMAFLVGLFTAAAAVVLWFELLMREAAVYVIVLMLPLAFAAMVWPARRIWAIRAVELLTVLIFSKFVIVAVLSLGGAALSSRLGDGVAGWLAGLVILATGAFAPWAMLRLVPLAELAGNATNAMRGEGRIGQAWAAADSAAHSAREWATATTAMMRRELEGMHGVGREEGPERPAQADLGTDAVSHPVDGDQAGRGGASPPAPRSSSPRRAPWEDIAPLVLEEIASTPRDARDRDAAPPPDPSPRSAPPPDPSPRSASPPDPSPRSAHHAPPPDAPVEPDIRGGGDDDREALSPALQGPADDPDPLPPPQDAPDGVR